MSIIFLLFFFFIIYCLYMSLQNKIILMWPIIEKSNLAKIINDFNIRGFIFNNNNIYSNGSRTAWTMDLARR